MFLSISMPHVPRMDAKIVEEKTENEHRQANQQDVFMVDTEDWEKSLDSTYRVIAKEADAQEKAQAQAQFPRQEEGTLARSTLTMFRQLDIEQKKTTSDNANAEANHGWRNK